MIRAASGVEDSLGGQVSGKGEMSMTSRRFSRTILAMKVFGIPVTGFAIARTSRSRSALAAGDRMPPVLSLLSWP
jgi:hypothetical protein